jgi:hypothetical protein
METNDELTYRVYTTKSEADKAINSLKGILLGISFDGVITGDEIKELDNWCGIHYELINRNPFQEFMVTIKEALTQTDHREELISDLFWLCQKYEADSYYYNPATADLQTLQGICHGILADGLVEDKEVAALAEWLDNNGHLASYYPYDEIRSLVASVLADGVIDEVERKQLKAYFSEFVKLTDAGLAEKIKADIEGVMISGICSHDPILEFPGKYFCFTGVSVKAKRSDIEKQIRIMGGSFNGSVTKSTDYLIIGDGGNPCWAYACYGRKVESAIGLRKQGHKILLINENDFWKAVSN